MSEPDGASSLVKRRTTPTPKVVPLVPHGQLEGFQIDRDEDEEIIERDWIDYLSHQGRAHIYSEEPDDTPILRCAAALLAGAVLLASAVGFGHNLVAQDHARTAQLALLAERSALKSKPKPTPAPAVSVTNTSAWFDR